ncbi:hypothetical protein LAh6_125 [Aeromonas phage LAh_6]|uniref:Band 7 domain-containing protein n=1 Tax=Aeromonas phage LAh_6 TaxID=2591030 RepID=A0A513ZZP9_9CAUD|nr:hypothetical protein HWC30_gp125 [Aeromonas phage LAh_6]QDH46504.1 hypothetical protein LAh6_125 [Aeromonas phage LAh_6]
MLKESKMDIRKSLGIALIVFVGLVAGAMLKPFKIINDTEEGVEVKWDGKVVEKPLTQGFNWVAPWNSVDVYPMTFQKTRYENLGVVSQDNLKTSMDISITGRFVRGMTPVARKDSGSISQFFEVQLKDRLRANILEAGKLLAKDSQDFYGETTLANMSEKIIELSNKELKPLGYEIVAVEFSDVNLPPVVASAVEGAKTRAEQVKTQTQQLKIADLKAQEKVKRADAESKSIRMVANANLEKAQKEADGKLYAAQKEAEGNGVLSRSLTPEIIKNKEAEAKLKWNGVAPTHVYDGDSSFIIK